MIAIHHSLLLLNFDPANSLIEVSFQNLREFKLSEAIEAIDYLVDQINRYEIRNLLIDSQFTFLSDQKQRADAGLYFATQIGNTTIVKMAKVKSLDIEMEESSEKNHLRAREAGLITWTYRSFDDKSSASRWLMNMFTGATITINTLLITA